LNTVSIIQKEKGVKINNAGIVIKPNPITRIGSSFAKKTYVQTCKITEVNLVEYIFIGPISTDPKHKRNKNIINIELDNISITNCKFFILIKFLFKKYNNTPHAQYPRHAIKKIFPNSREILNAS
jgi:hypothetical protein